VTYRHVHCSRGSEVGDPRGQCTVRERPKQAPSSAPHLDRRRFASFMRFAPDRYAAGHHGLGFAGQEESACESATEAPAEEGEQGKGLENSATGWGLAGHDCRHAPAWSLAQCGPGVPAIILAMGDLHPGGLPWASSCAAAADRPAAQPEWPAGCCWCVGCHRIDPPLAPSSVVDHQGAARRRCCLRWAAGPLRQGAQMLNASQERRLWI